jgi:hypothetical protein
MKRRAAALRGCENAIRSAFPMQVAQAASAVNDGVLLAPVSNIVEDDGIN